MRTPTFAGSRTKLHMEVVEVDVAIVGGGPAGEYVQVYIDVLCSLCSYEA